MSEYTFRFAAPDDSDKFLKWAMENDKIPFRDILTGVKENNPTAVALVIEKDGEPVLFAPVYAQINLSFLGFNPDVKGKTRLKALESLKSVLCAFAEGYGINEITVQTSPDYPVGQWALKHGFKEEPRQTFKLNVKTLVDPFPIEE